MKINKSNIDYKGGVNSPKMWGEFTGPGVNSLKSEVNSVGVNSLRGGEFTQNHRT